MKKSLPPEIQSKLDAFETKLRASLEGITLKNLEARQNTAIDRIVMLTYDGHGYRKDSPAWFELKQWRVRERVYKEIWPEVYARERALKAEQRRTWLARAKRMDLPNVVPGYDPQVHNHTQEQHEALSCLVTTFSAHVDTDSNDKVTLRVGAFYTSLHRIFGLDRCVVMVKEGNLLRFKYSEDLVKICKECGAQYVSTARAWRFESESLADFALKRIKNLLTHYQMGVKTLNLHTMHLI